MGQNEDEEETAIKNYNDAVDAAVATGQALSTATDDLKTKMGKRDLSQEELTAAIAHQKLKSEQEQDAKEALDAANEDLGKKTAFLNSEVSRIDKERAVLEEVLSILESLNESEGRRLLSFSPESFLAILSAKGLKVNPDSLAEVVKAVEDLITEGERLRAAAQQAVKDATAFKEDRERDYNTAVANHRAAVVATGEATNKLTHWTNLANAAQGVHDKADQANNEAIDSRDKLNIIKDDEIARVKKENSGLDEVKALLIDLL